MRLFTHFSPNSELSQAPSKVKFNRAAWWQTTLRSRSSQVQLLPPDRPRRGDLPRVIEQESAGRSRIYGLMPTPRRGPCGSEALIGQHCSDLVLVDTAVDSTEWRIGTSGSRPSRGCHLAVTGIRANTFHSIDHSLVIARVASSQRFRDFPSRRQVAFCLPEGMAPPWAAHFSATCPACPLKNPVHRESSVSTLFENSRLLAPVHFF
jgi:hypothetical protein